MTRRKNKVRIKVLDGLLVMSLGLLKGPFSLDPIILHRESLSQDSHNIVDGHIADMESNNEGLE